MNYILDTNVISELVKTSPDANVVQWVQSIDSSQVYLSVIAIGELKKGIEKLPGGERRRMLERWLEDDLLVRFENHLLEIDAHTMLAWASLNARLEASGRPISAIDALLAATALQWEFTLVTRNKAHFAHTGVALLNPWEE